MATDQKSVTTASPTHTRREIPERVLASLVRDSFEADLRARIDDAVDRQLAVFFAIQSVPSRSVRPAL
jgi:hypothetical protein